MTFTTQNWNQNHQPLSVFGCTRLFGSFLAIISMSWDEIFCLNTWEECRFIRFPLFVWLKIVLLHPLEYELKHSSLHPSKHWNVYWVFTAESPLIFPHHNILWMWKRRGVLNTEPSTVYRGVKQLMFPVIHPFSHIADQTDKVCLGVNISACSSAIHSPFAPALASICI